MLSELEQLVAHDMFINGYDSTNIEDIKLYWEAQLSR